MKKVWIILALLLVLTPFLIKGCVIANNEIQKRQDAKNLKDALSGHYSLIKEAPERIEYLLSPDSNDTGKTIMGTNQYKSFCENPELYRAYEIELFLENRSDIKLYLSNVYALDENVYVDNGYLICDKPILPGDTSDRSHDQTWLICKARDEDDIDIDAYFSTLTIKVEGFTRHGLEQTFEVGYVVKQV